MPVGRGVAEAAREAVEHQHDGAALAPRRVDRGARRAGDVAEVRRVGRLEDAQQPIAARAERPRERPAGRGPAVA